MSKIGILDTLQKKSSIFFDRKATKCGISLRSEAFNLDVIVEEGGIFICQGSQVLYDTDQVQEAIDWLYNYERG